MNSTKTISLLKMLRSWDLIDFEKFVSSPFFNKNQNLLKLFSTLKKEHPNYHPDNIKKEKIFKKVFGNQKFDERKLRYLSSDLSKLLEEYIIYKSLKKDSFTQKTYLLKFYALHGLNKQYSQVEEELKKELTQTSLRDSDFYFKTFVLDEIKYNHTLINSLRELDNNLQQLVNNLDYFYLSKKLKYTCEMLNRERILNINYEKHFYQEIKQLLEITNFEKIPSVEVYKDIFFMYIKEKKSEMHYEYLISKLDNFSNSFSKEELTDLYLFAQNYCTQQINLGNGVYLNKIFDLFQKMLELELVFENGYIKPNLFKNIVTAGLRLEKYEWTENFIYEYKNRLEPRFMDNAFTYNLAWLHFAKKEYKKTLRLLSSTDYMDVYYLLDSKTLLLKTFYELNEYEPFYALCDSFYVYLRRNDTVSESKISLYKNFIRYIKAMMKAKEDGKKPSEKLKDEIRTAKNSVDTPWLLKKFEELTA